MNLLEISFPSCGPWGDELTTTVRDLAHQLNQTPGMLWKIWIENSRTGQCGGVYLFADESSAKDFLKEHLPRLEAMGIKNVRAEIFEINRDLSAITRAPIAGSSARAA